MGSVINFAILREPLNWITVWTMLLIAWLAFEAISRNVASLSIDENS